MGVGATHGPSSCGSRLNQASGYLRFLVFYLLDAWLTTEQVCKEKGWPMGPETWQRG